ncbi:variable surface protein, partial [Plasmodium gonderi]
FDDYPDDHSLKILKDLENAYNIIEELNIKHNDCTSSNEKYEQYMNSLKSCQYSNKISFKLILKSIKDLYEEKCPKEKIPWDSSSMVTQTSEVTNNRTMESTKNTPETKSIVLSNEETTNFPMKESAKDTMTEKITRVYIGTFSLISYTPYGSYLLTWINNFKRRLNKKNKEHLNLMDSFEKRHENSIDERYRIAYNSVDYS